MPVMDKFSLNGRVAAVTGGARGIGRACADALQEMGATLALIDVLEDRVKESADEMGAGTLPVACDVTDKAQVEAAFAKIKDSLGRLDILVNSAGICIWAPGEEMAEEEWDKVVDINLKGTFLCCQAAANIMIPQKAGSIINIASMSGHIVNRPQTQVAYNASKAAVIHLTRSLAVEWAQHNVRVNSISPGYTLSELTKQFPQYFDGWMPYIPMGRMAEPEELVGAVVYLASDAASYTTGHDLVIDGGYTCW
ncbi:MAG: SDR family oxidoreductase [Armatimonadetes bacterium]|nr:SDR family oxidoreductase [Armatimonadota bacterium]